jgi:hypothetical protein
MRFPPGLIRESVEDAERQWAQTDTEPCYCFWLSLYDRETALDETFYLSLFSRFGFQPYV